ncbi:MAG: response regulator [Chloroflexaceae bacterium]|nr:response regulator [Chloroflexaceae bacterium]
MYRVLIAEDEERIAGLLNKGLRKYGFTAEIARNGKEALKMVQSGEFDLLLLDLGLPDMDGMEVLQELQTLKQDLPVMILSARADEQDIAAGFRQGAKEYVTKPFRFSDLLLKIAKLRSQ